ncbi:TatD family hydrolase [Methanobrevibacter sp. OttesenSCG-928-K11]|nr:TatD family hydrolase [Methanobrevibacter sp. OttesenSCG-928-K11]MDL2271146.1 TatD family hydrolase [Methanobrevibacter sp. OttesenSCG-928-I08]
MDNLIDIGINLMHPSFKKDKENVIKEGKNVGVKQYIITGTTLNSSKIAKDYAEKFPNLLYSTAGVHPHNAKNCDENTINELEKLSKFDCVVAIGECGLDYNRNFSPPKDQRIWFEKQVKLAQKLDMPLFLHEREAHEDLFKILEKYPEMAQKSVVHCFTGTAEEAQNYLDLGCYIGITGWVCDMKRGKSLQDAVKVIPPEKMMIETDAPFLIPKNLKEKPKKNRNEPKYLPQVLKTISELKDTNIEELADDVTKTTKSFFKI